MWRSANAALHLPDAVWQHYVGVGSGDLQRGAAIRRLCQDSEPIGRRVWRRDQRRNP